METEKLLKNKKIVFWGAGKVGRKILNLFEKYHIKPDFFCSNDNESIGNEINGIKIISAIQALNLNNSIYFITCGRYEEIYDQLKKNGVPEKNIIIANDVYSFQLQSLLYENFYKSKMICSDISNLHDGVIIDLNFGFVLGGVEDWSASLASVLQLKKIKSLFLLPEIYHTTNPVDKKFYVTENIKFDSVEECIFKIANAGLNSIICNFPYEIFISACIVKKYINNNLNIIAVIHGNEDVYYDVYCKYSQYINKCIVISKTIRENLIKKGFSEDKIINLNWFVPVNENNKKIYFKNCKLHIGYAGRISIKHKRLDLFLEIAEILKRDNVNFVITLAGTGDYLSEMKSQILQRGLEEYFVFKGFVPHELIYDFWNDMDICLMTSEFEGHSISVSEAMANGVVPVITNTSGAEDDVQNGYNGFISDIGDINSIVKNIKVLYENSELLSDMGKICIEKIKQNNMGFTINDIDKIIEQSENGCKL